MKYTYYIVAQVITEDWKNATSTFSVDRDSLLDSTEKIEALGEELRERCNYRSVLIVNFILLKEGEVNGKM